MKLRELGTIISGEVKSRRIFLEELKEDLEKEGFDVEEISESDMECRWCTINLPNGRTNHITRNIFLDMKTIPSLMETVKAG